jgi:pimeloyl-ACP methyl ester carboxylesterase
MKNQFVFVALLLSSIILQAQAPVGSWLGTLDIQGFKLRLVMHITETSAGLSATLDSPDQQAFGIPAREIRYKAPRLTLDIAAVGATFTGDLNAAGDEISGIFEQGGMKLPLVLQPQEGDLKPVRRPQDPQEPFPYISEEVRFVNPAGGHRLAGTLTLPEGDGPHPAVVLITGSGPQDRNEEIMNHRPFWVIADYLSRRGIAVLRYDDRGFAESEGDFASATTLDLATDVEAAYQFLRTRNDILENEIGLIGHSEGGIIAPIVAANNPDIAFIVLLAAPGLPGEVIVLAQQQLILEAAGISKEGVQFNQDIMQGLMKYVKGKGNAEKRRKKMTAFAEKKIKKTDPGILEEVQIDMDGIKRIISTVNSEWYRQFIQLDPRPYLERVQCPVLALNGKLDLQVPWKDNLEAIELALKKGGNAQFTTRAIPQLNHLFQTSLSGTGSPQEYGMLDETFNEEVLKIFGDWLSEQVKKT